VPYAESEFAPLGPWLSDFRPTIGSGWQICFAKEPRSRITSKIYFMKDESLAMSEKTFNRPANADAEIELLAREMHMPRELVETLYTSERAKLERTARIKTYIPVLIHSNVKALLQEQHRT
jgi:hypothetical protein